MFVSQSSVAVCGIEWLKSIHDKKKCPQNLLNTLCFRHIVLLNWKYKRITRFYPQSPWQRGMWLTCALTLTLINSQLLSTPERISLGFSGAKNLSTPPYVQTIQIRWEGSGPLIYSTILGPKTKTKRTVFWLWLTEVQIDCPG